ncbi:MAG: hypothetical protein HYU97_06175 [Deltaproteobacteria bacterium]|nr:hypothetical protein [Deltaproteobacteria bacterium]
MKKTLHLIAYALISLLVACGGGNPIEDLTKQLEDTPQGTGPTFAESGANNATIDAWVTNVLEMVSQANFDLADKAYDQAGIDDNATTFSLNEGNVNLNGFKTGTVNAKVSGSGTQNGSGAGSASFSVDSNFDNFSDKATLTITGTTHYALTASGNNDSAVFDINTNGVLALSGDYGAKMSFDVAVKFDLAELEDGDPNNDDEANVEVQGSAVVVSGNDTYECSFSVDTSISSIATAAHCTKK